MENNYEESYNSRMINELIDDKDSSSADNDMQDSFNKEVDRFYVDHRKKEEDKVSAKIVRPESHIQNRKIVSASNKVVSEQERASTANKEGKDNKDSVKRIISKEKHDDYEDKKYKDSKDSKFSKERNSEIEEKNDVRKSRVSDDLNENQTNVGNDDNKYANNNSNSSNNGVNTQEHSEETNKKKEIATVISKLNKQFKENSITQERFLDNITGAYLTLQDLLTYHFVHKYSPYYSSDS